MEKKHIVPPADPNGNLQGEYSRKINKLLTAAPV
jgi:hypothetical protein